MRAGVALGSNLGDRLENLRRARHAVGNIPGVVAPILASSVYETDPVNCEAGAPQFLNAVLEIGYEGEAGDLLDHLRAIEGSLGRSPEHAQNISRSMDVDLLYLGDLMRNEHDLQIPHPRMQTRRFVLEPLAEIRPGLTLPGQTKTIHELVAALDSLDRVVRLTSNWESP